MLSTTSKKMLVKVVAHLYEIREKDGDHLTDEESGTIYNSIMDLKSLIIER